MKKSELIFNVISVPVDFVMILLAGSLAYFLRYRVQAIPVLFDLSFSQYFQLILLPAVFLLLLFILFGLYNQKSTRSVWRELGKVITAVSAGLMIVVVLFFFDQDLFPSRLIILMNWILVMLFVGGARIILVLIQRQLLHKGIGRHRLVVVAGQNSSLVLEEIERNTRLGYEVVTKLAYHPGIEGEIETHHREKRVDELIHTDPELRNEQILHLMNICENLGIKFVYLPTVLEAYKANIEADAIGNTPVIRLQNTPLDGWGRVVKRSMDILGSATGLILTSPLIAVVSILIKLDSKGPIFFHQLRGSSFHNFEFYKFRSMYADPSEGPPQEGTPEGDKLRAELERENVRHGAYVKIKNDPRVTKVGRFLRKTKLDELPQLWHVLRGQMSLVGPRIHMRKEVEKFEDQHRKIFTNVKPGAFGLAQLNQLYNPELPFEEEIKLDKFYIENWSIWLDLQILLKSLFLIFARPKQSDY